MVYEGEKTIGGFSLALENRRERERELGKLRERERERAERIGEPSIGEERAKKILKRIIKKNKTQVCSMFLFISCVK